MSQESIGEEIKLQVEGGEDYARHNPRFYTYRVITVLGLEMNLDTIHSIDHQILKFAGEDDDDEDSFPEANEWVGVNAMDYNPEQYDDHDFDEYTEEDPNEWPDTPPLTEEEEEEVELAAKFPDTLA